MLALLATLLSCTSSHNGQVSQTDAAARSFVGIVYPPAPEGVTDLGGWLVDFGPSRSPHQPMHSISHMRTPAGEVAWLSVQIGATGGSPVWRVIATQDLPAFPPNAGLVSTCAMGNDEFRELVFGVADWTDEQFHPVIHRAWRVDLDRQAILEVAVTQVRCYNESYGV